MNFPRIEWGKGKRFDFGKYLNQPLLRTSKDVTFGSLNIRRISNVDRITSKSFYDGIGGGKGWGIYKGVDKIHMMSIPKIVIRQALYLEEVGAAFSDFTGRGQIIIKNTTPCELWFRDDVGTETKLA